jgi:hypothetical protein
MITSTGLAHSKAEPLAVADELQHAELEGQTRVW